MEDPLSWFLCPLIADALGLTTYPSHAQVLHAVSRPGMACAVQRLSSHRRAETSPFTR